MSDDESADQTTDESTGAVTDVEATPVTSTHKVLGQFTEETGAGVLGQNDAQSGTPKGVEGAVPQATDTGYGLFTDHDAKVNGVAELAALAGSLTGGNEVTNLAGDGITVDGSGNLNRTGTYELWRFISGGTSWTPVSGLSSKTLVEVTMDSNEASAGRLRLDVDGSFTEYASGGDVAHRIVTPSSSVTVASEPYFAEEKSGDLSTNTGELEDIQFKDDGSKMYALDRDSASIYSYSLSTAWDIDTRSQTNALDLSGQDTFPQSMAFGANGSRLFVQGLSTDSVYSYDLGSAWDISNWTFDDSFDISSETLNASGMGFSGDGSKMYICGGADDLITYDLSVKWDISSAGYTGTTVPFGNEVPSLNGVRFTESGSRMFLTSGRDPLIVEYALSTPYEIPSASLVDTFNTFPVTSLSGLGFKQDAAKVYVTAERTNLYQYHRTFTGSATASVETK